MVMEPTGSVGSVGFLGQGPAEGTGPALRTGGRLPKVRLASRSVRRRELLRQAGIEHDACEPGVDDGELRPGAVRPEEWVAALAYLKAAATVERMTARDAAESPVVLGADTVVVHRGRIIGQPRDEAHARAMLRDLQDAEHDVVTGVALVDAEGARRDLFTDRASVRVGPINDGEIDSYVASGEWRGKAGAYNLVERIAAGWPITWEGDPGTVMGLPMRRLVRRLEAWVRGRGKA